MKIYCDGSCPICSNMPRAWCYVVEDSQGNLTRRMRTEWDALNVAEIEYFAVIKALEIADEKSIIYTDSMQVYRELNRKQRIKERTRPLAKTCFSFMEEKDIIICKVNRKDNPAGKYLENRLKTLAKNQREVLNPKKRKRRLKWNKN